MYVEGKNIKGLVTHVLITEAHSAGFSFAKEKETVIALDEGRAFSIFTPAAHFTGVFSLWKQKIRIYIYIPVYFSNL